MLEGLLEISSATPPELLPLVEKAILQWKKIERSILSNLRIDKEQFLKDFEKAREGFLNGNEEWENFVSSVGSIVRGAIRNMDWVNLFSWVLPNADPENSAKHREAGKMITSIFYIELLSKHGKNPDRMINDPLSKIEARWRIVNQLKTV